MAKKKDKETKRPEATGLAAFREYNKKLTEKNIEEDLEPRKATDVISSGSIIIDHILGVGGFVKGTLHEIAGEAHSGKTTLCAQVARNVQRQGGSVAYLNTEQAFDLKYIRSLGVDTNDKSKWLYSTENSYEDLAMTINGLINVGKISAIIIDSVTAFEEKKVLEDDSLHGSTQLGVAARFWGNYLKKLMSLAHKNNVLILATNQTRMANIAVYGSNPFKDTTGGNALKFFKTTSLHLQGSKPKLEEGIDDFGDKQYMSLGNFTKVVARVDKNKWAPPFKSAIGKIVPYVGYDNFDALFKLALVSDKIQQAGAWISYGNPDQAHYFKAQGREAAQERIKNSPLILKKLVEDLGLAKPENYFPDIKF